MKGSFLLRNQRCGQFLLGVALGAFVVFIPNVPGVEFQNLDFEQATVSPTPAGVLGSFVDPTAAFPGWSVPSGAGFRAYTLYNGYTLGSPAQILVGPSFPNVLQLTPLQGSYSVELLPGILSYSEFPSLRQTGTVPATANSINFLTAGQGANVLVTLNGVVIPLVPIAGGRLAGDVASFAGQEAELRFTIQTNGPAGY